MSSDYSLFWSFAYASMSSALIPFLIGVVLFKKRIPALKVICLFCLLCFCFDIASWQFNQYANKINNLYRLIEFLSYLIIYWIFWQKDKSNTIFISLGLAYILFFVSELSAHNYKHLNSYSITLASLVFIFFSVRYFYFLLRDLPTDKIQRLPMFWINTGVLIYFAGGLFLFAMRNYLIEAFHDNQTMYWSFHNFLNIVKNLLFAVALWQDLRKPKPI